MERESGEHWAGRLYGRRVSIYVTRGALRVGVPPNPVTMIMIVVGLGGAAALLLGGMVGPALAALLIQVYLILDCVDGEVARWTQRTSAKGVYLDRLGHYLVESAVIAMFGASLALVDGNGTGWTVVGLVGAVGVLIDKAETDLVLMARLETGMGKMPVDAVVMTSETLARGRRLARMFPIHRLSHAVEATLVILLAAVVDGVWGGARAREALLVGLTVIIWVIVALHLVSVYTSARLTKSN